MYHLSRLVKLKLNVINNYRHWGEGDVGKGRAVGTAFTKSCGMFHRSCVPSLKGIRYDDQKLSKLQPNERLI